MDEIIGQGERLALKILSEIYPKAILAKQVPLKELLFEEYRDDMGEREKKEDSIFCVGQKQKNMDSTWLQLTGHRTTHPIRKTREKLANKDRPLPCPPPPTTS